MIRWGRFKSGVNIRGGIAGSSAVWKVVVVYVDKCSL